MEPQSSSDTEEEALQSVQFPVPEESQGEPLPQSGLAVGIKVEPQSSSEAEDDDTLLLQFQVREEGGAAGIVFGSGTV